MVSFKIDFPSLQDIIRDTDPAAHEEAFRRAANDVFARAIPKVNTRIKRKFNIDIDKKSSYEYVFTSKEVVQRKRSGRIRFVQAQGRNGSIKILIKGSAIDDYLFNYSYSQEISKTKSVKKRISLKRKMQKERNRPRVKILKTGSAKSLRGATFYATMASGHTGIFRRKGSKIIEIRTITPVSMFRQVNYDKIFDDHYSQNMPKRYSHYLKSILKGSAWLK